jgi:hypothetical protein
MAVGVDRAGVAIDDQIGDRVLRHQPGRDVRAIVSSGSVWAM